MIAFGLRLTLRGGREAFARLAVIVAAVAVGIAFLLSTLAAINAVNSQNSRYAWLNSGAGTAAHRLAPGTTPVWWALSADTYQGKVIGRIDVAATGAHSPVPPGIAHLPGPGQYYASPAMTTLLRRTPAGQLADRYPGTLAGTIGAAALPGPDALVIVIGRTPGALSQVAGAELIGHISTTPPNACNGACAFVGIDANGIDLILTIVTAALLFPVLAFVATATRLSAARREQRFAAIRLVGATPKQVSVISAVESTVAAAIGVCAGFGLFFAIRGPLAGANYTGYRFYLHDMSLNLADVLLVGLGVPVAAAVVARLALRRVIISPLGVTRRVTPRQPRAWRLLPVLAGLGELAWFVHAGRPKTTPGQIQAYLVGILLVMLGLVLAGPWLTAVSSRLLARRARRPATLIAARRLTDNPHAGFRAISGLALALFVGTLAIALITTVKFYSGGTGLTRDDRVTVVDDFMQYVPRHPPTSAVRSLPSSLVAQLRAIPGVHHLTVVHTDTQPQPQPTMLGSGEPPMMDSGVVACTDLAQTPALGSCAPGVTVARTPALPWRDYYGFGTGKLSRVYGSAGVSLAELNQAPVRTLAIATDGSAAAIERARTVLENAYPERFSPVTIAEDVQQQADAQRMAGYQRLADVVIVTSLPIAGCTLAVSILAGLNDRKRPFALLRLTGAPLATLRRVVVLESALPLLATALLTIATGFVTAYLFLRSQLTEQLQAPPGGYYLVVAAGLAASLAIIASVLPVLGRITGPETARNE